MAEANGVLLAAGDVSTSSTCHSFFLSFLPLLSFGPLCAALRCAADKWDWLPAFKRLPPLSYEGQNKGGFNEKQEEMTLLHFVQSPMLPFRWRVKKSRVEAQSWGNGVGVEKAVEVKGWATCVRMQRPAVLPFGDLALKMLGNGMFNVVMVGNKDLLAVSDHWDLLWLHHGKM